MSTRIAPIQDLQPQPWTVAVLHGLRAVSAPSEFSLVLIRGSLKNGALITDLIRHATGIDARLLRMGRSLDSEHEVCYQDMWDIPRLLETGTRCLVIASAMQNASKGVPVDHAFVELYSRLKREGLELPKLNVFSTFDSETFAARGWTCGQGMVRTSQDAEAVREFHRSRDEAHRKMVEEIETYTEPLDAPEHACLLRLLESNSILYIEEQVNAGVLDAAAPPEVLKKLQAALATRSLDEVRVVIYERIGQKEEARKLREWLAVKRAKAYGREERQ